MPEFEGPLFLVGMPRSGTKLLRGLLNEHSQIGIPLNETEFLPDWLRRWPDLGPQLVDRAEFQRFYDRVAGSVYFVHRLEEHGQRIDPDTWLAGCHGVLTPQSVFEALVRHDAGVPVDSGHIWGDKSPGYIAHLPALKAAFPRAKFIHIVRDVRDYCLSMQKAFGKSPVRAAQRWRDRVALARTQSAAFAEDYIEVRYEDLLADPAPTLTRLCGFVDRPFEPGMLTLSRATENLGDARGQRTIKADNTEKWRTAMPPKERALIERIAGDVLTSLGYPVEHTGTCRVSRPHMLALQVYDGVQLTRIEARKRGWPGALRYRLRLFRETGTLKS